MSSYDATLVSIVPLPIEEVKPGMMPSAFILPASEDDEPVCLSISNCSTSIYIGDKKSIKVPLHPKDVATAIVFDYNTSNLLAQVDRGIHPGFFWVPDILDAAGVKKNFASKLAAAKKAQNLWFMALLKESDDTWQRYHQHRMITDLGRIAARRAGLVREWLVEEQTAETTLCPACNSFIRGKAIVCKDCHCILDVDGYAKLSFANKAAKTA